MSAEFKPRYIALYSSGELEWRAHALEERLASCNICPRECNVDRINGETGFCCSGILPIVSTVCAHHGEEPAISGTKGSGTVFFGNCNMRCLYCQNHQISQNWRRQGAKQMNCHVLAEELLYLQDELGCHNINFVSPSHFAPQLVRTVLEAVPMGLRIPLIYNSSGYDSLATLKELDGIIDIYLPDLRYASGDIAGKYSHTPDYVVHARRAIKEMYRQAGDLIVDESGLAQRGLIVRHLVLPNGLAGSEESLTWLARELSPAVSVSIMSQYVPLHRALKMPLISRKISTDEYENVLRLLSDLGIENGWIQEMEASDIYIPDFEGEGHPFISSDEQ